VTGALVAVVVRQAVANASLVAEIVRVFAGRN
jgi:hypothetical protein